MAKKTEPLQVKVRMTKELQRRIQREADRNGQTINAEILARLAWSFEARKTLEIMRNTARKELGRMYEIDPPGEQQLIAAGLSADEAWAALDHLTSSLVAPSPRTREEAIERFKQRLSDAGLPADKIAIVVKSVNEVPPERPSVPYAEARRSSSGKGRGKADD
jgi:Arc-like DNA binding dprotein